MADLCKSFLISLVIKCKVTSAFFWLAILESFNFESDSFLSADLYFFEI